VVNVAPGSREAACFQTRPYRSFQAILFVTDEKAQHIGRDHARHGVGSIAKSDINIAIIVKSAKAIANSSTPLLYCLFRRTETAL